MNYSEWLLKIANMTMTVIVTLIFLIAGSYATYALWDNNTVYAAAENIQTEMLKIKPVVNTGESGASFEELLAINPDVRGWITLDNTNIDYPILQGETNLSYINTDVYGEFALAGSIFLDNRSNGTFRDPYSLVYGHDMVEGKMFGDLALYKNKSFFNENSTGTLILPNQSYSLKIYAVLVLQASDSMIFNPESHENGMLDLVDYTKENALYIRSEINETVKTAEGEGLQLLSLTTCSAEFTDARTIILASMEPSIPVE